MGNEWTDYVQRIVDFAHAFPRFSVMNNKTRPCIPEFLPTIFRVLEGLAGYPTVMAGPGAPLDPFLLLFRFSSTVNLLLEVLLLFLSLGYGADLGRSRLVSISNPFCQ